VASLAQVVLSGEEDRLHVGLLLPLPLFAHPIQLLLLDVLLSARPRESVGLQFLLLFLLLFLFLRSLFFCPFPILAFQLELLFVLFCRHLLFLQLTAERV